MATIGDVDRRDAHSLVSETPVQKHYYRRLGFSTLLTSRDGNYHVLHRGDLIIVISVMQA